MPPKDWMPRSTYIMTVDQAVATLDVQPHNLLVLHGRSGIGKTTLRKRLKQSLQQDYICAVVNGSGIAEFGFPSLEQGIIDLRRGLGQAGVELRGFDIAFAYYWAVAHPQQEFDATGFSKLQGVADHVSTWGDLISSLASDLQKTVPYVGTASKIGWLLMNYSQPLWQWYKQSGCDLSTIEQSDDSYEMLGQLPGLLARELCRALAESARSAVLLIDGYEGLVKPGKLSWIEKMATEPNPQVLWVLFAEAPLAWVDAAQQIQMQPLSEAESLTWLQQAGIEDQELAEAIAQLCQGLPIHLDACIKTWRNLVNQRPPQLQDFAQNTKDILAVYLNSVDKPVRQALMLMAFPRTWNQVLFQQLALAARLENWQTVFQQVTLSPYVEEVEPDIWRLNPLVRQYGQAQQSEPTQRQLHQWLFQHHQRSYPDALADRSRLPAALKTLAEALHHGLLSLQPQPAAVWVLEQINGSLPQNAEEQVVILEALLEPPSVLSLQQQAIARSRRGRLLMQLGQLEAALATLEQGHEEWRSLQPQTSLETAEVESDLAKIYLWGDRLFDARNACTTAKRIYIELRGARSIEVAEVLNQEAQIAVAQNIYAEAIASTRQALEIQSAQPASDPIALAKFKLTAAEILKDGGELKQAERYCQEALILLAAGDSVSVNPASKSEHPLAIVGYGLLGNVYEKRGQREWAQAQAQYRKALNLAETLLEPSHPQTLQCLKALARISRKLGDSEAAQELAERHNSYVAFGEGTETVEIAASLNRIGIVLYERGEYGKAEPLWVRSLSIYETQLGENHPDVAQSLNNLGELYQAQGRYEEVELLHVRSLTIREEQLGDNHLDVAESLNNLALLYNSQGRYGEAEPLLVRSLTIREVQFGDNHPDMATSLNNLAGLYKSQGRYEEAEPLYKRSLTIREAQLGENHPDVALSLNNLATLYKSQGRYEEAEPLYKRSLTIWETQLGENHPDVASSLNNLAELYRSQRRYPEAEPLYVRSLSIWETQLGENHPDVALSLNNLALLYKSQGRYGEAEPLYLRAVAILFDRLGENHPNTQAGWRNFVRFLQQVIQSGQTVQLSAHPETQGVLEQLRRS